MAQIRQALGSRERERLRREAKGRCGLGRMEPSDGQGLTEWNGVPVVEANLAVNRLCTWGSGRGSWASTATAGRIGCYSSGFGGSREGSGCRRSHSEPVRETLGRPMWGCWLQWSSWGTNSVSWHICLSLYQPAVSSVSSAGPESVLDPFTSFCMESPVLYRPRVSRDPVVGLSHPGG